MIRSRQFFQRSLLRASIAAFLCMLLLPLTTTAAGWTPLTSGTGSTLNSIQFINNQTGFIAASPGSDIADTLPRRGQILRTNDAGASWEPVYSGDSTTHLKSLRFFGAQHGIAVGFTLTYGPMSEKYHGVILRSEDGGATWNKLILNELDDVALTSVSTFLDTNLVVVGTKSSNFDFQAVMLSSHDHGKTWTNITPQIEGLISIIRVIYTSPTSAYFDGLMYSADDIIRVVYHSTDGLQTWERVTMPFGENIPHTAFDFYLDNTGIVAGVAKSGQTEMYRTSDAGKSWTKIGVNLPDGALILTTKFMNRSHIMALGEDSLGYSLILHSGSDGVNWSCEKDTLHRHRLQDIGYAYLPQMLYGDYAYLVGDNGSILRNNITGNPSAAPVSIEGKRLKFTTPLMTVSVPKSVFVQFDNTEDEVRIMVPENFEASIEKDGPYERIVNVNKEFARGVREVFVRYKPTTSGSHRGDFEIKHYASRLLQIPMLGIAQPTSVEEVEGNQSAFTMSPNPAYGMVEFRITPSTSTMQVRVMNILGQQVATASIPAGMQQWTLDTSALPSGVYYAQMNQHVKAFMKR